MVLLKNCSTNPVKQKNWKTTRKKYRRKITTFNPSFSRNGKTNIDKQFLKLIKRHFQKQLRTCTIFNKTTIEITAQKMKFSIKDFFRKFDQIRSFLRNWSHLLKKSLMENFIFCATTIQKLAPQSHRTIEELITHRKTSTVATAEIVIAAP